MNFVIDKNVNNFEVVPPIEFQLENFHVESIEIILKPIVFHQVKFTTDVNWVDDIKNSTLDNQFYDLLDVTNNLLLGDDLSTEKLPVLAIKRDKYDRSVTLRPTKTREEAANPLEYLKINDSLISPSESLNLRDNSNNVNFY